MSSSDQSSTSMMGIYIKQQELSDRLYKAAKEDKDNDTVTVQDTKQSDNAEKGSEKKP
ncbi:hypothetical protein HJFPF1_01705 [Paramyrothecium foliicola]|nr:hypothetical protein HJFPF1_01705 [Paramyrothecium foliicola]